ncbi:Protein decapentaplegic [Stylophora pistillata]|uniref:Protein decapentaplegic n=2 Tax=Stylophora pistillata TaxID=50429 RepID=A0A2B4SDN0_STYPI|nr:Protein decapentaplegic [Stylophora pistillata]
MLFATFASCFQSNASDTGETYRSLLGTQSQDRPPRTNSVTKSAEKSADYMLRLLQMFGPIKGNTLLGFTDIDGTSDRHLKFNISVRTKVLTFAELQLYKLPHDQSNQNFIPTASVFIFDIYSGQRLSSQTISMETVGWMNFTLPLDVINQWNEKPERNAGIKVNVSDTTMSPLIRFATNEINSSLEMLLLIHTTDLSKSFPKLGTNFTSIANPLRRMRRSLHPNHRGPCGRHELSVQFKDLGWDKWIIAPRMYSAYYCAGTCKNADVNIETTNHARIQLFLSEHDSNPPASPCCVPGELGSIDLLFYGEPGQSTYILKKMDEFVVMSCACL